MRKMLRTTGLAVLALSAVFVTGCGDDDEDQAQEQANSVLSQASDLQSQAQSQGSELQSQALSQVGELTEGLDDLTASVPELTETTEAPAESTAEAESTEAETEAVETEAVETEAPAETVASGDLVSAEDAKAAVEAAAGVTLADFPSVPEAQGAAYANQATMMTDGQFVILIVLKDPTAASAIETLLPQMMPDLGGTSTTVASKNVFVVYTAFGGTNNADKVKAAVEAL